MDRYVGEIGGNLFFLIISFIYNNFILIWLFKIKYMYKKIIKI